MAGLGVEELHPTLCAPARSTPAQNRAGRLTGGWSSAGIPPPCPSSPNPGMGTGDAWSLPSFTSPSQEVSGLLVHLVGRLLLPASVQPPSVIFPISEFQGDTQQTQYPTLIVGETGRELGGRFSWVSTEESSSKDKGTERGGWRLEPKGCVLWVGRCWGGLTFSRSK